MQKLSVVLAIMGVGLLGCRPGKATSPEATGGNGGFGGSAGSGSGTEVDAETGAGGNGIGGVGGDGSSLGSGGESGATGGAGMSAAGGTGALGGSAPGGSPAGTGGSTRITLTANKVMTCESPGLAVATQHIEAECAFGATKGKCNGTTGGQQGAQLEDADADVGFIEGGDFLFYDGVATDGITTLQVHYAKGVDGGKFEVRLDSATGTLIGTWTPTSTGAWTVWSDATVALSAAAGTHTIYLVAGGSTAGIANIDWLELSAGANSGSAGTVFHLNQLGFDTLGPKHAVVEGAAGLARFHVVGSDGVSVWCGDLVSTNFSDWGSSKSFYSVDFTELTRPGTFRVQVGSSASAKFEIGDSRLFTKTFSAVLGYFKASRADDADVWAADASIPFFGSGNRADVRGGWYDASGDISKYLTHLSYANFMNPQQIPLVAWALAWVYDQAGPALATMGNAAAVQAEALWGADYLLRVLDPVGYFYTNVFDHWSGDVGQRTICAFVGEFGGESADWQSALREGGGMSIAALARAARWKVDGSFTSAQYLAGAEKAFVYLNTNGKLYADDGKENVIDDYTGLLAASELYATTKNTTYLDAARARATSLVGRLSADGYFIADGASRPFWHASDAGLPTVALARFLQVETDESRKVTIRQAVQKHLDYLLKVTAAVTNPFGYARQHTSAATAAFFIPHENESGYWWQGENARLGSLAAAALMGAEALSASGKPYLDLLRFAGYQVDWILGSNPYDMCFLNGFGNQNPAGYCAAKAQNGTLVGGIANGITGKATDGGGIQWTSGNSCAEDWRWVEQWLPHAAWYMVATAAMAR
jgi:hypothetical protein